MVGYRNKAARQLAPESFECMVAWRRSFCGPFDADAIAELEALSDRIDDLWALHSEQLARDRIETEDTLPVWGGSEEPYRCTDNAWKDRIRAQGVHSEGTRSSSPYRRLKLAMDYWCALWFWPIDQVALLPTRDDFLNEVSLVLTGSIFQPGVGPNQTSDLFGEEYAEHADSMAKRISNEIGMLDLGKVFEEFPRLKFVDELATRRRFHHWELAFADIFYGRRASGEVRGGFDLVLGNPPWIKVEWKEAGVLGDFDPSLAVRKQSAVELTSARGEALDSFPGLQAAWFADVEDSEATQAFLDSRQNFHTLAGQKTNLYKCFLPQAWMIASAAGVTGLLHPEGVYDDPNAGVLRGQIYTRLRAHFQFANEKKLFPEVHHHTAFGVNVYGRPLPSPTFVHIANLYVPGTIDATLGGLGGSLDVPGLKDDDGAWNVAGHRSRVINVDGETLAKFASLYDASGTPPLHARLPALHSKELLEVIDKLAKHPRKLADLVGRFHMTWHWDETAAQRKGTIRRETRFPTELGEMVVSGPHFSVANPLNKTPREQCGKSSDYDCLDLTTLPEDYLPRTNYVPACAKEEYGRRTPQVPWIEQGEGEGRRVTEFYRVVNREVVNASWSRTLSTALIPKQVATIHAIVATVFRDVLLGVDFFALSASVVLDFFMKTTGTGHANASLLNRLPILSEDCPPKIRNAASRPRSLSFLLDHCLLRYLGDNLRCASTGRFISPSYRRLSE